MTVNGFMSASYRIAKPQAAKARPTKTTKLAPTVSSQPRKQRTREHEIVRPHARYSLCLHNHDRSARRCRSNASAPFASPQRAIETHEAPPLRVFHVKHSEKARRNREKSRAGNRWAQTRGRKRSRIKIGSRMRRGSQTAEGRTAKAIARCRISGPGHDRQRSRRRLPFYCTVPYT